MWRRLSAVVSTLAVAAIVFVGLRMVTSTAQRRPGMEDLKTSWDDPASLAEQEPGAAAAQERKRMDDLKRWGEPAELAKKNDGKTATLTLAIDGEDIGDVTFVFYAEDAPNTVENFIQLAQKGYYDDLTFHRVISGFMIQGGDPKGTGTGDPGWSIPAEFNAHKHTLGTVAMARSQSPDSAGSQFYICLGTQSFLDGKYTVFGQVLSGQEHVDRFGAEPTGGQDKPVKKLTMSKVVISE